MHRTPPYAEHVTEVRRRYGCMTPWRLGVVIGEAGKLLPAPYDPDTVGARCYLSGLAWGRSRWQALQQQSQANHQERITV
jgi:hypothetical protein